MCCASWGNPWVAIRGAAWCCGRASGRARRPTYRLRVRHLICRGTAARPIVASSRLFDRLRVFFDWYMAEAADGTPSFHSSASRKPIDSQVTSTRATLEGGQPRRLSRRVCGVPKAESDRLFQSVCGKGGSMGIFDLADVCAKAMRGGSAAVAAEAAPPRRSCRLGSQRAHHEQQRTRRRWSSSHAYSTHGRSGRAASSWHEWRGYIRYNRGRYSHFSTYVHTEL